MTHLHRQGSLALPLYLEKRLFQIKVKVYDYTHVILGFGGIQNMLLTVS